MNGEPCIVAVSGASQTGKTTWTMRAAGKLRRVIAWDPDAQWAALPSWTRYDSAAAFAAAVMAAKAGPIRAAFVPNPSADLPANFEHFARIAFTALDRWGGLGIVSEELADVSNPGKALRWWGATVRRGLKRGAMIYAISQRWAEADKTVLGNVTDVIVFSAASADDTKYLARKSRISAAQIDALQKYNYLHYSVNTRATTAGKVSKRT